MGVLLPVCRAYKSRQKVGRRTFSATRSGGEGETERGIPRPTDIPPSKCKEGFHRKRRQRFIEGEKDRVTEPETNGYQDRKRLEYRQIQSDGRATLPECGRRREASGRERRAGGALPGSAHTPASRVLRRDQGMRGWVSALEGRSGEQSESLTSPRPERSSKFAPCDH